MKDGFENENKRQGEARMKNRCRASHIWQRPMGTHFSPLLRAMMTVLSCVRERLMALDSPF